MSRGATNWLDPTRLPTLLLVVRWTGLFLLLLIVARIPFEFLIAWLSHGPADIRAREVLRRVAIASLIAALVHLVAVLGYWALLRGLHRARSRP